MILAHELSTSGARPERWMLFLHGILGRRANWRTFARRFVAARGEDWGAVLVDLRDHGESQGLEGARTVAAAGGDLVGLVEAIVSEQGGRAAGVLGHSFGAKVAISGAAQLRAAGRGVDELWIVDAPPGPRTQPRDRSTQLVFSTLEQVVGAGRRFEARSDFSDAIVGAGVARPIAQWLATNLVEDGGGYRFGLDLERTSALLRDFGAVDLWPTLEAEIDAGARVGLILGERSQAVFGDDLARAEALADAGRIEVHRVAEAGHWVHVDNPAGLLALLE